MLQLQSLSVDICRISNLLAPYNVNAKLTSTTIILDGEITDELLEKLCECVHITDFQNFSSSKNLQESAENSSIQNKAKDQPNIENDPAEHSQENQEPLEHSQPKVSSQEDQEHLERPHVDMPSQKSSEFSTLSEKDNDFKNSDTFNIGFNYQDVHRGEVYQCNLNEQFDYAIILKSNYGDQSTWSAIVACCCISTEGNDSLDCLTISFSNSNMKYYVDENEIVKEKLIVLCQNYKIDKVNLGNSIGKLSFNYMNKLFPYTSINSDKDITPINAHRTATACLEINEVQTQLLSLVNPDELRSISQSSENYQVKVQKVLELFGFDLTQNGVQYLLKAIVVAKKLDHFSMQILSNAISQNCNIDAAEVTRLIAARIKEKFNMRHSPAIDFIRIVKHILTKKEENINNEKNDI